MDKIGPNFALLKSPSNWFLVAFTMALLLFVSHAILKR